MYIKERLSFSKPNQGKKKVAFVFVTVSYFSVFCQLLPLQCQLSSKAKP